VHDVLPQAMPGGGAASFAGRDASAIPASTAPTEEELARVEDDPLADPVPAAVEPPVPPDAVPRPRLVPPEPVVLPMGPDVPPPST
jgi:hypothetical protein